MDRIGDLDAEYALDIPLISKEEAINGGLSLIDEETKARKKLVANPVQFSCAYCGLLSSDLANIKDHVVGRKNIRSTRKSRYISCFQRVNVDGIKEDPRKLPLSYPPPKRFPWATLICHDHSLSTGLNELAVSKNVERQWKKLMIDQRPIGAAYRE